jgi:hypothetical protein
VGFCCRGLRLRYYGRFISCCRLARQAETCVRDPSLYDCGRDGGAHRQGIEGHVVVVKGVVGELSRYASCLCWLLAMTSSSRDLLNIVYRRDGSKLFVRHSVSPARQQKHKKQPQHSGDS